MLGKVNYLWVVGREITGGASEIRRREKGGRHIFANSRRGGDKFSRRHKGGGRKNFAGSLRGGEHFLHVDYFGFLRENKGTHKNTLRK